MFAFTITFVVATDCVFQTDRTVIVLVRPEDDGSSDFGNIDSMASRDLHRLPSGIGIAEDAVQLTDVGEGDRSEAVIVIRVIEAERVVGDGPIDNRQKGNTRSGILGCTKAHDGRRRRSAGGNGLGMVNLLLNLGLGFQAVHRVCALLLALGPSGVFAGHLQDCIL